MKIALPEICPYLELFWTAFSRIGTEYDKSNSKFRHFLRSVVNGWESLTIFVNSSILNWFIERGSAQQYRTNGSYEK